MTVSALPEYIMLTCLREHFRNCNLTVNFRFLNSHNMRLVNLKESHLIQCLTSNIVYVYANRLQSAMCLAAKVSLLGAF